MDVAQPHRAEAVSRVAFVIIVAVIGTVLWPLRAVAATIPTFIAYDVVVRSTATTALGRYDAVRPDAEHANTACDCASFGYGEPSGRHLARGGGAVHAYDGAHEITQRREVAQGVIYDAPAAMAAAEVGSLVAGSGEPTSRPPRSFEKSHMGRRWQTSSMKWVGLERPRIWNLPSSVAQMVRGPSYTVEAKASTSRTSRSGGFSRTLTRLDIRHPRRQTLECSNRLANEAHGY